MDYFELINSSKEIELTYAEWYYQLPAERKAQMMCDAFQMGLDSVTYNYYKENPHATKAEALMFYMEQNLKPFFSDSTWMFVRATMEEKAEEERESALEL